MVARTRLTVTLYVRTLRVLFSLGVGWATFLIIWQLPGLSHLLRIRQVNVWHWGDANRITTRKTPLIASLIIANPTRTVL